MSADVRLKPRPRSWVLTGSTRVMDCCVFYWEEKEGSTERLVVVGDEHCARCVNEVRALGYHLCGAAGEPPDPDGGPCAA